MSTPPARRTVSADRPAVLAVAGAVLTATLVVAAGAVGPPGFARPFTRWGGLLAPFGVWPEQDRWPGVVLAVGVCGFAALWLATVRVAGRDDWSTATVWRVGATWLVPLVAGPPVLSNDVFSYVAQGAVATTGADPTRVSSMALGWDSPLVQAVDPLWRRTPSPYGPLATLLQRETVEAAGGHPVLAVVALRLFALAGTAAIAALAVSIARASGRPPRDEATILLLTWANPLLDLHVVGAVHLEGVLVALVLLAVRAAMTRTTTGTAIALVAVAAAAAVKLPVGAVTALVLAAAVVARGLTPGARLGRVAAAGALVVGTYAALCAAAGSGWDVLAVVRAPAAGRTPAAPATLLATALTPLRWLGVADQAALETAARALVAGVAVLVVAGLAVTARRRPPAVTTGLALLALAAGSPVLYPWYLVWSVPLLAAVATGAWRRRLVVLSALGAVMTVQGLTHVETWVLVCSVVAAVVVALVVTETRGWTLPAAPWRRAVVDVPGRT